jgi:Mce-associated membrane protein
MTVVERPMSGSTSTNADQVGQRSGRRNPLTVAGAVLVGIAVVAAGVFGVLWAVAAHDDSVTYSRMRDQALQAAEQGSINLTTLDYRHVRQGLDRWKQSTTGSLYHQLTQGTLSGTFTKQAQQAKAITTSRVKDGALTELDAHAGKASALVVVDVQVSVAGGKPTDKLVPLQWDLTLTGDGWKLSGIRGGQLNTTPGQ